MITRDAKLVTHLLWPRQDSELAARGPDRIAHRLQRPRQNRKSGAAAPTESRVRSGGPDKGVSCTDGPDKSVGHTATAPIEPQRTRAAGRLAAGGPDRIDSFLAPGAAAPTESYVIWPAPTEST